MMWENTSDQEKAILDSKQARVDQIQRAIGLAEAVLRLRNQPGFQEFVKIIEDLHQASINSLDGCKTSDDLWQVKGSIRAYKNILNVMRDAENTNKTLAGQLEAAQDEIRSVVGPEGRLIPSRSIWSF